MFEFSVVHYIGHYIVDLKQGTYDVPYMLLPYTTMQCGRGFPEEKKKLNKRENEYI